MLTIRNYVKAKSLEEAYELNQMKTNRILGGMMWLRMMHLNVGTAIDLCDLGLNTIEETDDEIILGAIATATAPAATLMVVRQYKAKGPMGLWQMLSGISWEFSSAILPPWAEVFSGATGSPMCSPSFWLSTQRLSSSRQGESLWQSLPP